MTMSCLDRQQCMKVMCGSHIGPGYARVLGDDEWGQESVRKALQYSHVALEIEQALEGMSGSEQTC
jgi:hypothetical protein